jgi:hypothetical protein
MASVLERERIRQEQISLIKEKESSNAIERAQRLVREARVKKEKEAEAAIALANELKGPSPAKVPRHSAAISMGAASSSTPVQPSVVVKAASDAANVEKANRAEALARLEMMKMAKNMDSAAPPPPPLAQRRQSTAASKVRRKPTVTEPPITDSFSESTSLDSWSSKSKSSVAQGGTPNKSETVKPSAAKTVNVQARTTTVLSDVRPKGVVAVQMKPTESDTSDETVTRNDKNPSESESVKPFELPNGWVAYTDEASGEIFYYCASTGESSWIRPTTPAPLMAVPSRPKSLRTAVLNDVNANASIIPVGWSRHYDEQSKEYYYFCDATRESVWELPSLSVRPPAPAARRPSTEAAKVATLNPASPTSEGHEATEGEQDDDTLSVSSTSSVSQVKPQMNHGDTGDAFADETLPPGWIIVTDPATKYFYYWNVLTNKTKWDKPGAEIAEYKSELSEFVNSNLQETLKLRYPELYRTNSELAFQSLVANVGAVHDYNTIVLQSFNSAFLTAFVMMRDIFSVQSNVPGMGLLSAVGSSIPFASG